MPHRANAPLRLDNVRQSAREAVGKPKTQTGINLLGVLPGLVNRTPEKTIGRSPSCDQFMKTKD
jgi:hypothetical protein